MKTYKLFVLSIGLVFSMFVCLNFISAAANILSPIAFGNYSTILNVTVNSSLNATSNVTCWYNASGGTADVYLIEMLNITGEQIMFNSSVNIAAFTDARTYNISCSIKNLTAELAVASINISTANIRIDNTPPNVTSISASTNPLNIGNYSRSIIFNISILDPTANLSYMFFNITNWSNGQSVVYPASRQPSTNWWNATINTSLLNDGAYNVTIWANDSAGNMNSSLVFYNVSFDNTAPTVTHSCTPLYPGIGDALTCSCSGLDPISGVLSNIFTINPSTNVEGTQTTTCISRDYAGNNATSTFTYYVSGSGSTPSDRSSSGTTYTNTYVEDDKELSEKGEITKSLSEKSRIRIKINSKEHNVGVSELTTTTAKIEVSSVTQKATLSIGDERKFDVNEDRYYDLSIILNSIESNKADITIKSIREEVTEESETSEEEKEGAASGAKEGEATAGPMDLTWLWIVIAIVVVLIGIGYGAKKKGYL